MSSSNPCADCVIYVKTNYTKTGKAFANFGCGLNLGTCSALFILSFSQEIKKLGDNSFHINIVCVNNEPLILDLSLIAPGISTQKK